MNPLTRTEIMAAQSSGILLKSGTNEFEIVEFYLDELLDGKTFRGSYGINVAKVVEIIRQPKVTPVPMAPDTILGTFVFRGSVVPLIDLGVWLEKTKPAEQANPLALVTQFFDVTIAFAVSGINRIHRLRWEQVQPSSSFEGISSNSITGIVKIDDINILILDMEKIVAVMHPLEVSSAGTGGVAVASGEYKVLLVDDSPSIIKFLSDILSKEGFEVVTAGHGGQGLQKLRELQNRAGQPGDAGSKMVDIVISDIEMPEMDGYTFCQTVKNDPAFGNLPVILFSSLITENQRHKGMTVGADDQISKPQAGLLADKARELIRKYSAA